jgi:putative ABC transport system ATP-binding protein
MLQVRDLHKKFNKQIVLQNINYTFSHTGLYYLLGESGSGKTTLINIIAKIDKEDSGEVHYNGLNVTTANNKTTSAYRHSIVGMIFQNFNLVPNFTIKDNFNLVNGKNAHRYSYFKELLNRFGVIKLLNNYPHEISGGEQQRVALARTLAFNYPVILADEPTGSLDRVNTQIVMEELLRNSKERLVIIITHDVELTSKYKGRVIKIENGLIDAKNSKTSYIGAVNLIGKNIDPLFIIKNAFKSIKIRKLNYFTLILVITLILSCLLIIVSAFSGFRSYSQYLSAERIDANYFSIYKYVNQESVNFEVSELNLDESQFKLSRDYEELFNNYFKQVFSLPENEFYELKIVNELVNKVYVNSLFNDFHSNSLIKIEDFILVPFNDSNKLSFERVKFNGEIMIDDVIAETNIYNVAKIYMSFGYFLSLFEGVKLPLIGKQMNIEDLDFASYHLNYANNLGLTGIRFDFSDYYQRKAASDSLIANDKVYSFFNSAVNKDFFQLRLNDEIFETTLFELINSLELIMSILTATLAFTLINIGSLVISYSFRKRRFELSILKVFGATNLELVLNLIFEVAIIAFAIIFLTTIIYLCSYMLMLILISNGLLMDFNYLPISTLTIFQIIFVLLLVMIIGSLDALFSIYRINVSENLRHD